MTLHVPEARVQVVLLKVPVELLVKVTVPVGTPKLEVTIAVQLLAVLSRTLAGEQETDVELVTGFVVRVKVPLLPEWTESALYVAVMR